MYELSIVVPTRNRADALLKAILGIEKSTHISHEIIVVDGASTDATNGVLMLAGSIMATRLRVIREGTNLGFASACNKGVAIARGRNVCVLHDDVHPEDGALEAAVDRLDRAGDDTIVALSVGNSRATKVHGITLVNFPVARRQTFIDVPLDTGLRSAAATLEWSLRASAAGKTVQPTTKSSLTSHADGAWENLTGQAERKAVLDRAAKTRTMRKAA
jgi:glycosyltransferase involved in cell wall biosynthesis